MRTIDDEVRERVYEVLEGSSLDDFEEWFVAHTWDQRSSFVAQVDHLLAERTLIGREGLNDELRRLVETISYRTQGPTTGSSAQTREESVELGRVQTIRKHLELAGTSPASGPE
jgi:hypothetical protein